MKKQLSTPVLAVLAIASWLATSSLATWLNYAYDGALNVNPVYLWIYGAITLLILLVAVEYIERDPPRPLTPLGRRAIAFTVYRDRLFGTCIRRLVCLVSTERLVSLSAGAKRYCRLAIPYTAFPTANAAAFCTQQNSEYFHPATGVLYAAPRRTTSVSANYAPGFGCTNYSSWQGRRRQIYRPHHGRPNRKSAWPLLFRG